MDKHPKQDPVTKEWLWRGKWYAQYPRREIEEYNARYDEWMERKLDEMRDEETQSSKWKLQFKHYG